jgi:hypothetical protein
VLIALVTASIGTAALFVAFCGTDGALKAIRYNLVELPGDQFRFFGSPPMPYLKDLRQLFLDHHVILCFLPTYLLLAALMSLVAVCWKKPLRLGTDCARRRNADVCRTDGHTTDRYPEPSLCVSANAEFRARGVAGIGECIFQTAPAAMDRVRLSRGLRCGGIVAGVSIRLHGDRTLQSLEAGPPPFTTSIWILIGTATWLK